MNPDPGHSLEERKFEQDKRDKQREFDLREREVATKEKEITASRWSSPLVISLLAAALGLAGNIWVEHANNKWKKDSERSQAQSNLILEAIKTGSTDKACQNLLFFVHVGFVDDSSKTIERECAKSPQGPPSLPSNSSIRGGQIIYYAVVRDADTGAPIKGAEVGIITLNPVLTDDNGEVRIPTPMEGGSLNSEAMYVYKAGYKRVLTSLKLFRNPQVFSLHKGEGEVVDDKM